MNLNEGKLELLSDLNSVLVLVDYQPTMIKSVSSGDKTIIKNAAIFAAKAASILDVPVVLSSINPHSKGMCFQRLLKFFRIKKCLQGKFQVLMHLKMIELLMRLKKQIGIK